jgi:dihydroorotase
LKSTKSQRIANTIQNTLENMQEEENKIIAHAEQLDSNSVLFMQKENERRENAVEGLRQKLDELNG